MNTASERNLKGHFNSNAHTVVMMFFLCWCVFMNTKASERNLKGHFNSNAHTVVMMFFLCWCVFMNTKASERNLKGHFNSNAQTVVMFFLCWCVFMNPKAKQLPLRPLWPHSIQKAIKKRISRNPKFQLESWSFFWQQKFIVHPTPLMQILLHSNYIASANCAQWYRVRFFRVFFLWYR